jgi:hypothetical protein
MPRVTIRTGMIGADGQEVILTDYLCDWPDCANVAEHLAGFVRELALVSVLCREHAAIQQKRTSAPQAD